MSTLSPGTTISHYRIKELIARGGMGEVYKALDTRLGRLVALKIPSESANDDEKSRRRFLREAHAASRISHPNICTILDIGEVDGRPYIVMEYIEGPTIQEMLSRGPLAIEAALKLAVQIADALEESHRSGIIHRDLKPSNIIMTPRGMAMILDFGLAKRLRHSENVLDETPTVMQSVTTGSTIIGTVAYMSPEQVRTQPLDARSDVFSFGVLLFEMLTGLRPFSGPGQVEILHAILHDEVRPPSELRPEVDATLEGMILRAMRKNPDDRYQSITQLKLDIWDLIKERGFDFSGTTTAATTGRVRHDFATASFTQEWLRRARTIPHLYLIGSATLLVSFIAWYFWPSRASLDPTLLRNLETVQLLSWKRELGLTQLYGGRFSANGKSIVFSKTQSGNSDLFIKQVTGSENPIAGTDDAARDVSPIFSPDDEEVAFLSDRGGVMGMWRIPRSGGTPTLMMKLTTVEGRITFWSQDGKRLYHEMHSNLYRHDVGSQTDTRVTDFEPDSLADRAFSVTRDESRIAFLDKQGGQLDIWVRDIKGGDAKRITNDSSPKGSLIWHADGRRLFYMANRHGTEYITVSYAGLGEPMQLMPMDATCTLDDVSADGTRLLYSSARDEADIWRVDVASREANAVTSDVGIEFWPSISPDGKQVAFQFGSPAEVLRAQPRFNVLVKPVDGNRSSVISTDGYLPKWSPDGLNIAFLRKEGVHSSLWVAKAIGGNPERLTQSSLLFGGFSMLPFNRLQTSDVSWSPNGAQIASSDGANIRVLNADGSAESAPLKGPEGRSYLFDPIWSPDGKQIAFQSLSFEGKRQFAVWIGENGATRKVYERDHPVGLLGWTDGGKSLLLRVATTEVGARAPTSAVEIYRIGVSQTRIDLLQSNPNTYLASVCLSPDGKTIAYVERPANLDSIKMFDLNTKKVTPILRADDSKSFFAGLTWAPDSKSIYFSKHTRTQGIAMIDHLR